MVKTLTLKRVSHNDFGTYGILIDNTTPFALTLEKPWITDRPNYSCIPAGVYWCKRTQSQKFGNTFEIQEVPERTGILFHPGDVRADTFGWILVADRFDSSILQSRKGFEAFMRRLKGEKEFVMHVIWA